MKLLLLLRHGKSSWDDPGLADHDRPILEKGARRTFDVISYLRNEFQVVPELIISSTALRARQTAQIAARIFGLDPGAIIYESRLYDADTGDWLAVVRGLDDACSMVLLVGHNPGITAFANRHCLGWNDEGPLENIPTSGCVGAWFEVESWMQLQTAEELLYRIFPKEIPRNGR